MRREERDVVRELAAELARCAEQHSGGYPFTLKRARELAKQLELGTPRPPAPPGHKHRVNKREDIGPDAAREWCRCGALRYQTMEGRILVWSEWRAPRAPESV